MHLVGLTFIYYSKMHGHSNIKLTNSMFFALIQDMKYLEQWNPISAIRRYEYNVYIYLCLVLVEIMCNKMANFKQKKRHA